MSDKYVLQYFLQFDRLFTILANTDIYIEYDLLHNSCYVLLLFYRMVIET